MRTFELKAEHIKLLRAAYVSYGYDEFGAPCIDPKRPYGNGNVLQDIALILDGVSWDTATESEIARYRTLHEETETALQIVLRTGSFEPGIYQAGDYTEDWVAV